MINTKKIKQDFPFFLHNPRLIYLDSAATSLKPKQVIDKEFEFYTKYPANIYRGIYKISEKATIEYENVRSKVAQFIGAGDKKEIIFVRNTTEAINLVTHSWAVKNINNQSEVVITIMEHHANFVPWQILCKYSGAKLKITDITDEGLLNEKQLLNLITSNTKIVALTHVSNVLGTINPVKKLIKLIKSKNPNCLILIDGAQAIPHIPVNVRDLGCDFYAFSGHKMLGPTGVGVLWGRYELLHQMQPYQYGGEMIQAVYIDHTEFKEPPHKFEAGTPNIAGVIGLGKSIDYLQKIGMEKVRQHEQDLISYALKNLGSIKGIRIMGPNNSSSISGLVTFTIDKIHAHDIAQILDSNNICIRSGHHCAMPLHLKLNINSSARASFYIYTNREDIDALVAGLIKVKQIFD